MFGNCSFANYMLSMMIILSNMCTTFYIYPIIFDYLKTYSGDVDIYLYGLYLGVII
jgi:hypothetical protein